MSITTSHFDILVFAEIFVGKPGGIPINVRLRAHSEGRSKTFPEDIWELGESGEPITFLDISDFLDRVKKDAEKWEVNGTYWFEEISFLSKDGAEAQFLWGT